MRRYLKQIKHNLSRFGFRRTVLKTKEHLYIKIKGLNKSKAIHIKSYTTPKELNKKKQLEKFLSPVVSIIIPAYNQWKYTYACISSILDNVKNIKYEIILADDNSNDNTVYAKNIFQNITVVRNPKNLGFLCNCNHAATFATGKYLVFLNNDTQVLPYWLESLVELIENSTSVGLVGSKLIYANGALQEAGGIIWQDGSGCNYGRLNDRDKSEYNYVKEADYISGASILIPRALWQSIGGFDTQFMPAYYEDTDLCFAVRKMGYKVMYQPLSEVIHFEGVSHGTTTDTGIKAFQRINAEKFKIKWEQELQHHAPNQQQFLFLARDRSLNKRTILVIDQYVPKVDREAGAKSTFSSLAALVELGLNVKFMGHDFKQWQPYTKILQQLGVEVLYGEWYMKNWKSYLIQNKIDYFLLCRADIVFNYLEFIRSNHLKGKVIYYGHDLGYIRLEQEYQLTKNILALNTAQNLKQREIDIFNNVDINITCSCDELNKIILLCTKPVNYIPIFSIQGAKPAIPLSDRNGLIFVGGFGHYPNDDAVFWFLSKFYREFNDKGIVLRIVGSNIPQKILQFKYEFKYLEFYSDVSEATLDKLYAISRVMIAPLRIGAGVKGKTVEAMSKGLPVVGTNIAYEGLPNLDNLQHSLCADREQFIFETNALLSNDGLWQSLSDSALNYISNNFSPRNITAAWEEIFTLLQIK